MWSLDSLELLNHLAHQQAVNGDPERDALFLMTDPRRKEELAERSELFHAKKKETQRDREYRELRCA